MLRAALIDVLVEAARLVRKKAGAPGNFRDKSPKIPAVSSKVAAMKQFVTPFGAAALLAAGGSQEHHHR